MSENDKKTGRTFLKNIFWMSGGRIQSDQMKKVPPPPLQKPYPEDKALIELIEPEFFKIGTMPLLDAINRRRSRRKFTKDPLSLEELSFLLWVTQGVQQIIGNNSSTWRTVPSGGARHPFETYLYISLVDGLQSGLYRYLSIEHKLYLLRENLDQPFPIDKTLVAKAPIVFIWTVIPYRTEWRYGPICYKIIAQETGHVCQNLYLACESIGIGCCAIAAYSQELMDQYVGVDGQEEFVIYAARVGKVKQTDKSLIRLAETLHGYRARK